MTGTQTPSTSGRDTTSRGKAKRRSARRLFPALAALLATVLIAACGGSSTSTHPAARTPSSSTTHSDPSTTTDTSSSKPKESMQAYARCIRAHGVPNFKLHASPTGSAGGGSSGHQQGPYGAPSASMKAMQAAHKACVKYEPVADRG